MRRGATLVLLVLLGACSPHLRAKSAEVIHCPESDIQVSDEDIEIDEAFWTATCHGARYKCHSEDRVTTCHPRPAPAPAP